MKLGDGPFDVTNCRAAPALVKQEEEALENIREAIELYLQPDLFPLAPTAVTREVFV